MVGTFITSFSPLDLQIFGFRQAAMTNILKFTNISKTKQIYMYIPIKVGGLKNTLQNIRKLSPYPGPGTAVLDVINPPITC